VSDPVELWLDFDTIHGDRIWLTPPAHGGATHYLRADLLARRRAADAVAVTNAEWLAEAVLLFHRGGPWSEHDQARWLALTGSTDATVRALCDFARRIRDGERCPS
jgi:hypothetical protein